jgi:hypothetical protein
MGCGVMQSIWSKWTAQEAMKNEELKMKNDKAERAVHPILLFQFFTLHS